MLSIIIPVLNEAAAIAPALTRLQPLRPHGVELIVVDGGSDDNTAALSGPLADRVTRAPRGRASQMNAGAAIARGDVLMFLHIDTRLPDGALGLIRTALSRPGNVWGHFDVRIDSPVPVLALVSRMMNLRSRLSGMVTGDRAMFVRRAAFDQAGGFPDIALMEDLAISRVLKRIARPVSISTPAITSARRWQTQGVLRTIVLMWRLRLAYFLGADPADLARRYGYRPRGPSPAPP